MALHHTTFVCPKCQGDDLDPVPYVYQILRSDAAGRRFFADPESFYPGDKMDKKHRERLLHRLTPPPEPKKSLPAGAIAIMAFVLSWLITGSLLIGRIGQTAYFVSSLIVILCTAFPFYATLRYVDREFRKSVARYNRIKPLWNKQYFCNGCHHVFIPKKGVSSLY